jgi:putative intracellular protease/amidase
MVLTGAKVWTMKDGRPHPTGFWAEEFIKPHKAFIGAGLKVDIATPGGVKPTVDPLSLSIQYNNNDASAVAGQQSYLKMLEGVLATPLKLEDVRAGSYDVIFLVGGHGPMQDMAVHPTVGDVLAAMLDDPNKIVAGVCHGPAGFLSAHRPDGTWLFKEPPAPGGRAVRGPPGVDSPCSGRRQPHNRAAADLRRVRRQGGAQATQGHGLSHGACGRAADGPATARAMHPRLPPHG